MNNQKKESQFVLKKRSGLLYKQLEKILQTAIESGELEPDAQIPDERQLAIIYGFSRNTVRKAIANLVENGYLFRVPRSGTFVSKVKNMGLLPTKPEISNDSLIKITPYFIDSYIRSEMLFELDEVLSNSQILSKYEFHPELLKAFTRNGKLYGVPIGFGGFVAYVNVDLLNKKGFEVPSELWTFEDYCRLSEEYARFNINGKQTDRFSSILPWIICIWAMGGEVVDKSRSKMLIDSLESLNGIKAYHELALFNGWEDCDEAIEKSADFTNQKYPIYFGSRANIAAMEQVDFNWTVLPVPQGKKSGNWVLATSIGILSDGTDLEHSWKVLEEFVKAEFDYACHPLAVHIPGASNALKLHDCNPEDLTDYDFQVKTLNGCHFLHTPTKIQPMKKIEKAMWELMSKKEWPGDKFFIDLVAKVNFELAKA